MKTSLKDLAADLGTTDRTLRRAVRQGLLRAERPSPRTLDVSLAERVYLRRSWPLLSSLRESLRTEPTVSLAALFGSQARGEEHGTSDLDLLLALREGADRWALASRLSQRVGARVQIVELTDALAAPVLLAEVVREGRVIVDRAAVWPRLQRRRAQIERDAARERLRIDDEFRRVFGTERAP
jgi:predicted nucleotidyltransferase